MKIIAFCLLLSAFALQAAAAAGSRAIVPASAMKMAVLAPEGNKNMLPGGGWFTWKFSEKPKLGNIVIKVRAFSKGGVQESPYEITGEAGMASMRDHDTGPVKFQLNRKGDYLLPVGLVMTGEWQLTIRVKKGKNEIYAGKVVFSF